MRQILIGGFIFIFLAGSAFSAELPAAPDPASAAYGARPLGMGGAFTSLANDTNAIFTNPAGLGVIEDWSVTSMSTQLLRKVNCQLAGGSVKLGPGTFGIGYIGTSAPAGYKYDGDGNLISSKPISYNSSVILLSYGVSLSNIIKSGKGMGNVAIGGSVKAISKGFSELEKANASGTSMDIGLIMRPNKSIFSFGASINNIGSSIKWVSDSKEIIEGVTKLGASAKLIGADGMFKDLPGQLVASADLKLLSGGKPAAMSIGAEYKVMNYLALRAGLDQEPISASETSNCFTAGVGVEFSGFRFDYAYKADPDSSELSNHYFSISYAPEIKNKKNEEKEEENIYPEDGKGTPGNVYDLPKEYKDMKF
jgi:hypothetical protein